MPRGEAPVEMAIEHWRTYLSELTVLPDWPYVGKSLKEVPVFADAGVTVVRVFRQNEALPARADTVLQIGDRLTVTGTAESIMALAKVSHGLRLTGEAPSLTREDLRVWEVLVGHRNPWIGHTLIDLDVRRRYHIGILGLYREGQLLSRHLGRITLRAGDILLMESATEALTTIQHMHGFIVLNQMDWQPPVRGGAIGLAPAILVGSLLLAALNLIPLRVAVALGVFLMAVFNILPMTDAYRAIEWRIVVFVAGMLPLGTALIQSGITHQIVEGLYYIMGTTLPGWALIGLLFALSAILTQVLSNIATVLVLAPVAIELARQLGVAPAPLVLAVVVAVSASPLTPLANKVDLLIMGPGGYRYGDFLRVGAPLTILLGIVSMVLIPAFFLLGARLSA